jgi:hypothetical protein
MSRRAFTIVVVAVLLVVAGGLAILASDTALQWAVREAHARAHGKLAIEGARGSLLSRIHADRVRWRGESNAIDGDDVDVSWSPLWLFMRTVAFDKIHAKSLNIASTASKHEPWKLPEKLSLPMKLRFDDAAVDTLSFVNADGDARTLHDVSVSFATGPDKWSGKLVGVQTTWGKLTGSADVETAQPFAMNASFALSPEGRAQDVPPLSVEANAKGDLSAFDLTVDANAQTSKANAKLRIEPFAPEPVSAIDAALHAVDVRHVLPSAPQIVLDGTLKAEKDADGVLRGPLDLANRASGTVDQHRLPIARLTSQLAAAPERWWLEELVIDGLRAKWTGSGWVTASETGFVLVTDGADLHAVHPSLRSTRLAGTLHTSGPFDRQQMRVALADRRLAVNGEAVYEPQRFTVKRVDIRAGRSRFDASGSLALDAQRAFTLKTAFSNFDPSQFGNIKQANLNGNLAASGQLVPVLHVKADGRLSNSTLWGLPVSAEARWASNKADEPTIAFDVKATAGQTRVSARGTVKDPKALQALDVALDLSGDDLQELYTITGVPFPSTPAYRVAGSLVFRDKVWTLRGFDGKVGNSDLTGEFSVDVSNDKPFMKANLTSQRMDMTDLGGFIGHDYHAPDPAPDKLLPRHPFRLDKLNAANADVTLTGKSFRNERLPLTRLVAHLRLDNGRLTLDPLRFGAAGGDIDARVTMDARRAPIRTSVDIAVRELQLAKLAPGVKAVMMSAGTIDGRTVLAMTGRSFGDMLGSADGNLMLAMNGGSMSDLVLRLADLDVAHAITVLAKGDRNIPLRCVVADFAADDGVLQPKIFVLDSEHTVVKGEGALDLETEALDLRLVAEPKDASLFALGGPIRLDGTLKHPAVHPELGQAIMRTGAAIALGALAPPAAIIPFLRPGKPQEIDCGALREQAAGLVEAAAKSPPTPGQSPEKLAGDDTAASVRAR